MKHTTWPLLALVVAGVAFLLIQLKSGRSPVASAGRHDAGPSYQQRLGAEVYRYYCETCHGAEGKGDGFNAFNLDPKPPDFSSSTFHQERTDVQLAAVIAEGRRSKGRSTGMPPWGRTLSSRQQRAVLLHVRKLGAPVIAAGSQ